MKLNIGREATDDAVLDVRRFVDVRGGVAQTVQRPEGDDVRVQVESAVFLQQNEPQGVAEVHVGPGAFVERSAFEQRPELGVADVVDQILADDVDSGELFEHLGHVAAADLSRFLDVVMFLRLHVGVGVHVDVDLHVRIGPGRRFDSAHAAREQATLTRHLQEGDALRETG